MPAALYRHNISLSWPAGQQFNSLGAGTRPGCSTSDVINADFQLHRNVSQTNDTCHHADAVLQRASRSPAIAASFYATFRYLCHDEIK